MFALFFLTSSSSLSHIFYFSVCFTPSLPPPHTPLLSSARLSSLSNFPSLYSTPLSPPSPLSTPLPSSPLLFHPTLTPASPFPPPPSSPSSSPPPPPPLSLFLLLRLNWLAIPFTPSLVMAATLYEVATLSQDHRCGR